MFLDTSVIIEMMLGDDDERMERILNHIRSELLFISMAQISEVSDWCWANSCNVERRIEQLKEIVHLIPLNEDICVEASKIKAAMRKQRIAKFSLMDGLILASSRYIGQTLLTLDTDFRKAEDVIIIK